MPVALNKVMGGNFKTRLLPKPQLGNYKYGNQCHFARNGEIRLPNEMQLCRPFYEGGCRFLHVNAERCAEVSIQFRNSSVISILSGGSSVDNRSGSVKWEHNKGLAGDGKTKLCPNREIRGAACVEI
ncbi:hypothetical protein AB3S75_012604 [Citrus x aurantiifolia]